MDGIETPMIEKYVRINAREAARAHREFRKEYTTWLKAYKSHDVKKIQELARARDLKARKASMAYHQADKFLIGLYGMWELKY
jgi:hypothetical protein